MTRARPARAGLRLLAALVALVGVSAGPIGAGERQRVDIAAPFFAAIGQVNNGSYGRCTGVLIARQTAITAAHCLFNARTGRFVRPASVHLVLGYDRGAFAFQSTARGVRLDPAYDPLRPFETASHDWALLDLAEPAPPGIPAMGIATKEPEAGDGYVSAGFGRERAYALTSPGSCRLVSKTGNGLLVLDCSVTHGYSGGPLIDAGGRLAGIVIAGAVADGRPVALAVPAAAWQGGGR